jgi:DNA primase catalytic subunit
VKKLYDDHVMFPTDACAGVWRMLTAMQGGIEPVCREFAILYKRKDGLEGVQRHVSFETSDEFVQFVERRRPVRLDIGPVYSRPPASERLFRELGPSEEPCIVHASLRFDLDINDYNERPARTCCLGAEFCPSCWKLLAIGCQILDVQLRYGLGVRKIGWFFSGRRGMHAWVLDDDSYLHSPNRNTRTALIQRVAARDPAELIERAARYGDPCARFVVTRILVSSANTVALSSLDGQAPPDVAPGNLFLDWYADRFPDTTMFALRVKITTYLKRANESDTHVMKLVNQQLKLATPAVRAVGRELQRQRQNEPNTDVTMTQMPRTEDVTKVLKTMAKIVQLIRSETPIFLIGSPDVPTRACLVHAVAEAAAWCLLPRIDHAVTNEPNHLLKAPLSIHQATQEMARRVDHTELLSFYPKAVHLSSVESQRRALFEFDNWTKTL